MKIMQFVSNILNFGPRCASKAILAVLLFSAILPMGRFSLEAAATRLLILDVRAGENVESPAARAFFRRFSAKLRSTGLVDITLARAGPMAARASDCREIACAAEIARGLKIGRVLLGRVRKPGRDYVAEMLVITASARVEIRIRERLPSLEPEDREQGSERMARRMEAEMRRRGYRPPRRLTPGERWLTILPGAGQYFKGRYIKSGLFISAGFLAFENYRNARLEHRRAREQFDDTGVPALIALGLRNEPQFSVTVNTFYAAQLRDNLDARARSGNIALLLLGGLLVWNFLDAENDYEYFSAVRPRLRSAGLEWRPRADSRSAARSGNGFEPVGGRIRFVLRVVF